MTKRKTKPRKRVEAARAWVALSADDPPQIWYVNWYRDKLERPELKQRRAVVLLESDWRRILKQLKRGPQ